MWFERCPIDACKKYGGFYLGSIGRASGSREHKRWICSSTPSWAWKRPFVSIRAINATMTNFYELIGEDKGVFGCMSLLACHGVCPKNLPLSMQTAFLRRKMAAVGWK